MRSEPGGDATRDFLCDEGHYTPIAGYSHWTPWGSTDFEARAPLRCGVLVCSAPGHLLSKDEQQARDNRARRVYVHGRIY